MYADTLLRRLPTALHHPCVIAFYGIVVTPGSYATVIEYVRMGSLRSGLHKLRANVRRALPRLSTPVPCRARPHVDFVVASCRCCMYCTRCLAGMPCKQYRFQKV